MRREAWSASDRNAVVPAPRTGRAQLDRRAERCQAACEGR
jgi:hypothetical protein